MRAPSTIIATVALALATVLGGCASSAAVPGVVGPPPVVGEPVAAPALPVAGPTPMAATLRGDGGGCWWLDVGGDAVAVLVPTSVVDDGGSLVAPGGVRLWSGDRVRLDGSLVARGRLTAPHEARVAVCDPGATTVVVAERFEPPAGATSMLVVAPA